MIQNIENFIDYINSEMDSELAIGILKEKGANQMTCTKVIRKVYGFQLKKADDLVQNSKHWAEYREGNIHVKNEWFK